jgi:hypothetical protein
VAASGRVVAPEELDAGIGSQNSGITIPVERPATQERADQREHWAMNTTLLPV